MEIRIVSVLDYLQYHLVKDNGNQLGHMYILAVQHYQFQYQTEIQYVHHLLDFIIVSWW